MSAHVESTFEASAESWSPPELVNHPWVKIDGLSSGLNYGQQVFDGLKACRNKSGDILLFRPRDHWQRLNSFASSLCMPSLSYAHFLKCVRQVLISNMARVPSYDSKGSVYLRLLMLGSGGKLAFMPSDSYIFCVFMQPVTEMTGEWDIKAMVIEDADVPHGGGYDLAGSGASFGPTLPYMLAARKKGYLLGLHLDRESRQYIAGFSDRSFIGAKVSPQGRPCLTVNGSVDQTANIALDSCLELAKQLDWKVEKQKIEWSEAELFDEVLAVNTSSSIIRISALFYESAGETFGYPSGENDESSILGILRQELLAAQRGERPNLESWNHKVMLDEA